MKKKILNGKKNRIEFEEKYEKLQISKVRGVHGRLIWGTDVIILNFIHTKSIEDNGTPRGTLIRRTSTTRDLSLSLLISFFFVL